MLSMLVAILLVLPPSAASAEAFRCKQADGKVSFQDQPCQAGASSSSVKVREPATSAELSQPHPTRPARAVTPPHNNAPKAEANEDIRAANQRIEAHNRGIRCDRAKRNLGVLKEQRPVYRYDQKGERQYVDDSARAAEVSAAQRAVAANCG